MTIAVVDTVDEAVDLANQSSYSLTSSLWTQSIDLAFTLTPRIHAGKVIVNSLTFQTESRYHQAGLGLVLSATHLTRISDLCHIVTVARLVMEPSPPKSLWQSSWSLSLSQRGRRSLSQISRIH
jgi:acyl-CoA reductase-like NAD-dependent aldehyde dehydrogenase